MEKGYLLDLKKTYVEQKNLLSHLCLVNEKFWEILGQPTPDSTLDAFFQQSVELICLLTAHLVKDKESINFDEACHIAFSFQNYCSSVGAVGAATVCTELQLFCRARSHQGCLELLRKIANGINELKSGYGQLTSAAQQIRAAGAVVPEGKEPNQYGGGPADGDAKDSTTAPAPAPESNQGGVFPKPDAATTSAPPLEPRKKWKGPNKISRIYGDWIDDSFC